MSPTSEAIGRNWCHEARIPAGWYAAVFAEDSPCIQPIPPLSFQIHTASNVDRNNDPRSFQARCQSCRPEARCMVRTRSLLDKPVAEALERTIVNEAATASPVQPIVNMGQGFL